MRRRLRVLIGVVALAVACGLRAETVDPRDYEVFLVPLSVDAAPGAYGTMWQTSFSAYHDGDIPSSVIGYDPGFDSAIVLPARHTYTTRLYTSGPADPPGVLLYLSRNHAAETHFELHFRNVGALSAPVALPVLRETDLLHGRIVLLRVPGGSGQRRMLRIYAPLGDSEVVARITVADELTGNALGSALVTLRTSPDVQVVAGVPFRLRPTATQVSLDSLFPAITGLASVTVVVEPVAPDVSFWAFVTATNNVTQAVTLTLPN
jgi:hypothetical protein